MDAFEVKLTDSIDLGIAGDDVDELFTSIANEFGTDFGELAASFDLYLHPEVTQIDGIGYATLLAISGLLGAAYAALHGWLPHVVNLVTVVAALSVAITVWIVVRNQSEKPSLSTKRRFTLNEIVDAVVAGIWSPPPA